MLSVWRYVDCQVSRVSTFLLPLFTLVSIHYLTRQTQLQPFSIFTAATPQVSTLSHHCGCHTDVNEHQARTIQGQSLIFPFLCLKSHVLPASTTMLNGTSHPAYSSTFFSHCFRLQHILSSFRLLTNSFSATLRVWLRFAASGKNTLIILMNISRRNTSDTVILTMAARESLDHHQRPASSLYVYSTEL